MDDEDECFLPLPEKPLRMCDGRYLHRSYSVRVFPRVGSLVIYISSGDIADQYKNNQYIDRGIWMGDSIFWTNDLDIIANIEIAFYGVCLELW